MSSLSSSGSSLGSSSTGNSSSDLADSDHFYYFAFGSNLLTERIHVQIKGAEFHSVGVLSDHRLAFFGNGRLWHGGVASIIPVQNSDVWGCVWRVPNDFGDELDRQESTYHRLNVQIYLPNYGTTVTCRTYQYSGEQKPSQPSPQYKEVIVRGATEHQQFGFPDSYMEFLRAIPTNGYRGVVDIDLRAIKHINTRFY